MTSQLLISSATKRERNVLKQNDIKKYIKNELNQLRRSIKRNDNDVLLHLTDVFGLQVASEKMREKKAFTKLLSKSGSLAGGVDDPHSKTTFKTLIYEIANKREDNKY